MPDETKQTVGIPPRWFVRAPRAVHRGLYLVTRGCFGLWPPKPDKWGTMRLTTIGRRTGQARSVILGYYEDGPNVVTMAMNGWADDEPAWWLNLPLTPWRASTSWTAGEWERESGRRGRAVTPVGSVATD